MGLAALFMVLVLVLIATGFMEVDVLEQAPSPVSLCNQILVSPSVFSLPWRVQQQLKLRLPLTARRELHGDSASMPLMSLLKPLLVRRDTSHHHVAEDSKYPTQVAPQVAVLRGLAGSGKTLSSWAIWNTCITAVREQPSKRYCTPVHISLPEFRTVIKLQQDLLEAYFHRHAPQVLQLSLSDLRQHAELFVILDGLDEVSDTPVNLWRDNGLAEWRCCRFLLTARREFLPDHQLSKYVGAEGMH